MVYEIYNLNHLNLFEHIIIQKQRSYANKIIVILKMVLIWGF